MICEDLKLNEEKQHLSTAMICGTLMVALILFLMVCWLYPCCSDGVRANTFSAQDASVGWPVRAAMQPRPSSDPLAKLRKFNEHTPTQHVKEVLQPQLQRLISNPRSITALLKGLSCPDVALKVLDELQGAGLAKVNLFHFSALLGVCERRGSWQLAVKILSQMRAARHSCRSAAWCMVLLLFPGPPSPAHPPRGGKSW